MAQQHAQPTFAGEDVPPTGSDEVQSLARMPQQTIADFARESIENLPALISFND